MFAALVQACRDAQHLGGRNAVGAHGIAVRGMPSVSVPVLSTINVSIRRKRSIASASLNSTPPVAPRPVATMMDIGVARPRRTGTR